MAEPDERRDAGRRQHADAHRDPARGRDAGGERVLEHESRAARVAPDQDARVGRVALAPRSRANRAEARPRPSASSAESDGLFATPRTPSVPNRRGKRCLALAELRAPPGALEAGLLALDLACIARQEALLLERRPQLGIGLAERTCDPVAQRAGLAGDAAAVAQRAHVEAVAQSGQLERRRGRRAQGRASEVLVERAAVDRERARCRASG